MIGVYRAIHFLSKEAARKAKDCIKRFEWDKRRGVRTMHFGFERKGDRIIQAQPIPETMLYLCRRIKKVAGFMPNQLTIRRFVPGQGLRAYIEPNEAGPSIAIVPIGSHMVLRIHADEKHDILVPPQSLALLRDEARYKYPVEIPRRLVDEIDGLVFARRTCAVIFFRQVKL